jgi:hypothetical protein
MPNIIALLLVIGFICGLVAWVRRRRARPERRLMRDFKRLRRLILTGLERSTHREAKTLLEACEGYLESLLLAKEQQRLLGSMAFTAGEITGQPELLAHHLASGKNSVDTFDKQVAEDLANFFASLSRVSTVVGLRKDDALRSLRGFTEELEDQREALLQLSTELGQAQLHTIPSENQAPAEMR